jgi:23S rRNA (cytosine1962-C5)-methyltransferase
MDADHPLPTLRLKRERKCRAAEGHPWVFAGEVEAMPDTSWDGEAAVCRDARGRLLGSGIVNTRSQILWRQFSLRAEAFDEAALVRRLEAALARRGGGEVARLVWSECDQIPGLTVDRFGAVLVGQALTLAVEQRRERIESHLLKATGCARMVWRDDAPVRTKEGLEVRPPMARVEPFWLEIEGVDYFIDPCGGQKTGFYLDQREQHRRVAALARGRRVLDCFCHHGGFALQAMKAGASAAQAVDASAEAVAAGKRAAERNGVAVDFIQANAFDFLKTLPPGAHDLIVLDPPPFAPGRDRLEGAMRGYKEINLRALKSLAPGGILATYACSHHVGHELFRSMLADAARDAGRTLRLLETARQPGDHPVMFHFPESEYLRGFLVEVAG